MTFTFLDMAGNVLFLRDDAEKAELTTHELSLLCEFPYDPVKEIQTGQRVLFKDHTGTPQIYEIKQPRLLEPDNYQQVTAEHICISELSDEHIDNREVTDKTAREALQGLLAGTLWNVGNVEINPISSCDFSRGSVWQAVLQIKENWNVYIEPRVTIDGNGQIARYLDVINPAGVWEGLYLSVDKNISDPAVVFDDTEVATALVGYGGTIRGTKTTDPDVECNFSDVVWTATADHPAKPKGQKWIEDPEATRLYGRDGRKRWAYFQNNSITDPEILLEKTWEALKKCNAPALSIEGVVADLYRMGYKDQPVKLHNIALTEIKPVGMKRQLQIIQLIVDLLNPLNSSVVIGSYIPNIIYINRDTNSNATGSRGGGGGNKSRETERKEFETAIESINNGTGLRFRAFQNDLNDMDAKVKKQEASITIEHNRITAEVTNRQEADNVLSSRIVQTANSISAEVDRATSKEAEISAKLKITADAITTEVTNRQNADNSLSSRITQTADSISAEVERATAAEGSLSARITVNAEGIQTKVSKNGVISAINQTAESIKISASKIELDGSTLASLLTSENLTVQTLTVTGEAEFTEGIQTGQIDVSGGISLLGDATCDSLEVGTHEATWKSATYETFTHSATRAFMYAQNGQTSNPATIYGFIATGSSSHTIHYLGY